MLPSWTPPPQILALTWRTQLLLARLPILRENLTSENCGPITDIFKCVLPDPWASISFNRTGRFVWEVIAKVKNWDRTRPNVKSSLEFWPKLCFDKLDEVSQILFPWRIAQFFTVVWRGKVRCSGDRLTTTADKNCKHPLLAKQQMNEVAWFVQECVKYLNICLTTDFLMQAKHPNSSENIVKHQTVFRKYRRSCTLFQSKHCVRHLNIDALLFANETSYKFRTKTARFQVQHRERWRAVRAAGLRSIRTHFPVAACKSCQCRPAKARADAAQPPDPTLQMFPAICRMRGRARQSKWRQVGVNYAASALSGVTNPCPPRVRARDLRHVWDIIKSVVTVWVK